MTLTDTPDASSSLLRRAGTQRATEGCCDGAGPCRRSLLGHLRPDGLPVLPAPTFAANDEEPRHSAAVRYLWAMLLARIYEAFPLLCPICHAEMRIIAFINEGATVKKVLEHIGEATQPPRIAPARGHRYGRRRNERAMFHSGMRLPSPHRNSSSISASPGRCGSMGNQVKPALVMG